MQEDTSKITSTIPELYYDILSRLTVGVVFQVGIFFLITKNQRVPLDTIWAPFTSPILILLLISIQGYILGILIESVSQAYETLFRIAYDPAVDAIKVNFKLDLKSKIFLIIEILLGMPFSLLVLKQYVKDTFENDYKERLNEAINKKFPSITGVHRTLLCRDYVISITKK